MTRNEFFQKLEARLNILNEQERNDILSEYSSHIEFKMQDGKTEEQAIADFGDVDALAEEILSAYHIDTDTVWNKNGEYYIKKSVSFINHATERLLSFSLSDVAKVVAEFFVVLFVILLVSIPFNMIGDEVGYLLGFLPRTIDNAISSIVKIALDLVSLIIAFIILYSFVKTRIINRKVDTTKSAPAEEFTFETGGQANFDINTGKPLKKVRQPKEKTSESTFGRLLANVFIFTLKIIVFLVVWLPAIFITISAIVITVLLTIMLISRGIGLWGLCIIGAGCSIMGIGFTAWTTQVLFGGKNHG